MSSAPAVEIRGLVKRYGGKTAVAGLSLTAARAKVTAILGPNGAGKTTTIETCEGYRRPDAGTVAGARPRPGRATPARLRPRVGVMLQAGGVPTGGPGRGVPAGHGAASTPTRWTRRRLLDRLGLDGCGADAATGGCPAASSSGCRWPRP